MIMESKLKIVAVLIVGIFCLSVTSLAADTYRWKDEDGKVHYGSVVPAEYADQPYDILNNAGVVIEHVMDTAIPAEIIVEQEQKSKERKPLISMEERQLQSDRLLLIQYRSEEEILTALELEIAQLGYELKLVNQSYASTSAAIREQIRQAANQQRANIKITEKQQNMINILTARRNQDEKRLVALNTKESQIRARLQADLERYLFLTSDSEETKTEQADQG